MTFKKKSKETFIYDLLIDEDLTSSDRERLILLAKGEREQLEQITGDSYPLKHNAPELVELLKKFSLIHNNLKYTTHSWEPGAFSSYEDFIAKINREWNVISLGLKRLKDKLHAKIFSFLFSQKLGDMKKEDTYFSWGEKYLKFGWSSTELALYMQELGKDPFECPIPDKIRELDKKHRLFYFGDYVSVFKNEIEIRQENQALAKLFNELWGDILGYDFNLEQKNTKGVSFFTDVEHFKFALKLIFKSFAIRHQYQNILVDLESNHVSGYILLKITQKGSICERTIDDAKISNPQGGDLLGIINSLKNLADFSILSKFRDGKVYRVNYTYSTENTFHFKEMENDICEGFTYELKFYL